MTILQLISSSGFYGAERMLLSLANASQKLGNKTVVGVFEDVRGPKPEIAGKASQCGLRVELIKCSGRFDMSPIKRIRSLVIQHKVDVIHTHGYKADLYGFAARRSTAAALVSTCHNWPDPSRLMQAYAVADRFVLRQFEAVASPSLPVKHILEQSGIAPSNVSFISNGIELDQFQHAQTTLRGELQSDGKQVVGFVGRLVEQKGGDVLIKAAKVVLNSCPESLFVFVGEGECAGKWRQLSVELGIADKVLFVGRKNDMPGVYASINLLALPSFDEAMPMCILEAMAASKPVVASNVGSVADLVLPGLTGSLVPAADIAQLAASITELLKDPEKAAQFGRNGFRHAQASYSSQTMARNYHDLYSRALSGQKVISTLNSAAHN